MKSGLIKRLVVLSVAAALLMVGFSNVWAATSLGLGRGGDPDAVYNDRTQFPAPEVPAPPRAPFPSWRALMAMLPHFTMGLR